MLPCTSAPDLFFAEHPGPLAEAKELCAACPVRDVCFAGAQERREAYGVWGGEIFVNGAVVTTKRGRGRPRRAA